jgi:hypothetical protein
MKSKFDEILKNRNQENCHASELGSASRNIKDLQDPEIDRS